MRALCLLLLLSACADSPAPQMTGATRTEVTVAGRNYAVYRQDKVFEVVRYGWAARDEQAAIRATMLEVVAKVTGCTPHVASGDSGEMRGALTACRG